MFCIKDRSYKIVVVENVDHVPALLKIVYINRQPGNILPESLFYGFCHSALYIKHLYHNVDPNRWLDKSKLNNNIHSDKALCKKHHKKGICNTVKAIQRISPPDRREFRFDQYLPDKINVK